MDFSVGPKYTEAVLYARVSSEDQMERGTIDMQVDFGQKYCDLHQIQITDMYKDDGITGTLPLPDRPEGRRLLDDAKAGKIKLVLLYKVDRIGRTARIILNAIYDLEQYGVTVRSMTEPFDTSTPYGRFALTMLAGVADLDREMTLKRLWDGANTHAAKGKWLGGIVPYGYRVNEDGYLEINETPALPHNMSEADVVRLIYQLVTEQGMSTIKIADYLNALGIPPSYAKAGRQVKKGKRKENTSGIWLPGRVRNMIVNTTYKGVHYYGRRSKKQRELVERAVPAIVSEEVWEKAQEQLRENQLEAMRNAKNQYLLRGLVKCGCCGLNYHGVNIPNANGKHKAYYICNGKIAYRGPLQGKCQSKNIPQEWIESIVWHDCLNYIKSPELVLAGLSAGLAENKDQQEKIKAEKEMLLRSIDAKDAEKQSILDLYRKKLIDANDVENQLQKILTEKAALQSRLEELDNQAQAADALEQQFYNAEKLLADLRSKLDSDDPPFDVKREIVKTLVKEVRVETKNPGTTKSQASVAISYLFQIVPRTDNRAWNCSNLVITRQVELSPHDRHSARS